MKTDKVRADARVASMLAICLVHAHTVDVHTLDEPIRQVAAEIEDVVADAIRKCLAADRKARKAGAR